MLYRCQIFNNDFSFMRHFEFRCCAGTSLIYISIGRECRVDKNLICPPNSDLKKNGIGEFRETSYSVWTTTPKTSIFVIQSLARAFTAIDIKRKILFPTEVLVYITSRTRLLIIPAHSAKRSRQWDSPHV